MKSTPFYDEISKVTPDHPLADLRFLMWLVRDYVTTAMCSALKNLVLAISLCLSFNINMIKVNECSK